jgi:sugar lactone lactonase YvrE
MTMPHIGRVNFTRALAAIAIAATCGAGSSGQTSQNPAPQNQDGQSAADIAKLNSLPNPYKDGVEGWAKMPEGRKWGAPSKVYVDPDGKHLWVAERCGGDAFGCAGSNLAPILEFDPSGKLVKSFGEGMFVFPHGFHVDKDGNVWATDGHHKDGKGDQVFKFSHDGKLLLTLGKAGEVGGAPDSFNQPPDVAVAPNGDIFVSDGHQGCNCDSRIVKFSKDGKFIKAWGQKGTGPGDLQDPHCLAFDSQGRLFVCDRRNLRIEIFDQDGKFIDAWKQFGRPSGIFISKDDTMYVAEQELGIIIGSAKDGSLKAYVPTPIPPPGVRRRGAESVALDSAGNLYTGEIGSFKLMKYEKK